MKKSDLISACGISSTTKNKIGKDKDVDMESLNKICNYFNCQLSDIIEHIPDNN